MTTGAALRGRISPRAQAALHIAAYQVLDQCFDDLAIAERRYRAGRDGDLAEGLTIALLPRPFRDVLLASRPYVRTKAYFCTLVAVCWKLAQRDFMPLASRAERATAKALCEVAAHILDLAYESHDDAHLQAPTAASLQASWQVIGDGISSRADEDEQRRQEHAGVSSASTADRQAPAVGDTWQAWFETDTTTELGQAAMAPHPYALDE